MRPKTINTDVLAVLSECRVEGEAVFLPPRQLDRKLYQRVNEVLEALGGKWNRKTKSHVFEVDPTARFEDAILTGSFERPEDFGFFPTPLRVALRLIELAEMTGTGADYHVLEPSAGRGAIADAVRVAFPEALINCVELLHDNANALADKSFHVIEGDFLAWTLPAGWWFNRVIMNPPFARQADIDHVRHAFGMLRPGGILVSVMAAGVRFRQDRKATAFRDLVEAHDGLIEDLPLQSFRASGTDVNTVIVKMVRP